MYRSFTSLVNFILKYFILFDAIVNGIIFLISFSDNLLLVHRNTTDFCTLILYPAILLNVFISFYSFVVKSLGFSIYKRPRHLQRDNFFTSTFPIWMPFISFSCLVALARTPRAMLNRSGESGHTCLVLDLRGKASSSSSLSIMLAMGLSYWPLLC